tara:strand:- start:4524 stop:5453 length:930 start_codon:yes stop_codon:yes gene_type:complete
MNTPDYTPLWTWMRLREAARERKDAGLAPPYSDDPVISAWRFCNVRREDDRVTRWIRVNIRERFAGHPYLWFMLCVSRQINWPDTLAELIDREAWPDNPAFTPSLMTAVLNDRMKVRGDKTYGAAYTINAPSTKGADKQQHVAETLCGGLWDRRDVFADRLDRSPTLCPHGARQAEAAPPSRGQPTLQGIHELIRRTKGWGDFMAYQAVVDMRFTPLLETAADVASWAAAGPGTLRGLNRLHGRPTDKKLSQDQALSEMRRIYKVAEAETGIPLDFSDVPNILCETDKYLRVIHKDGPMKAAYVPGRGA